MNYYNTCQSMCEEKLKELKQSELELEINEKHVLEGKLWVDISRKTGYVEVRADEVKSIITKYFASVIVASMRNSNAFVNMNNLYHFDQSEKYKIQVFFGSLSNR